MTAPIRNLPWSDEQTDILIKLWDINELTKEQITSVFPDRTWNAICKRAERLNLPLYSDRFKPKIDYKYLQKLGVVIEG